jgi:hypothetical protein
VSSAGLARSSQWSFPLQLLRVPRKALSWYSAERAACGAVAASLGVFDSVMTTLGGGAAGAPAIQFRAYAGNCVCFIIVSHCLKGKKALNSLYFRRSANVISR